MKQNMKRIAFDVMGNDKGLEAGINAVNNFIKDNKNFFFYLVGNQYEINKYLIKNQNVEVINTKKVIDPTAGIKKNIMDKETSMSIAIDLVKQKKANVVISSGDSSLYLGMTTLILGRLKMVRRPAFMVIAPTINLEKKVLMLDVGANLIVTSEMLIQWARIGHHFSQKILKIKKPTVAIINVGHEKYKGQDFHFQAYQSLSRDKSVNFKGFVEPREILQGKIDVVVTDGYAGNMILKTIEGTIKSFFFIVKNIIKSKFRYKIAVLILKRAFKKIKNKMDYRNVGAAWIIGLKNLVVKCHGNADEKSYLGVFNQIKMGWQNNIEKIFKEN